MLHDGYRSRGGEQHASVVEYLTERFGEIHSEDAPLFDQMRRKRHRVIYEVSGVVSKTEAEQAIRFADKFISMVMPMISGQEDPDFKGDK